MLISTILTKIDKNQHAYFLLEYENKYKMEWKIVYFQESMTTP